MLLLPLPGLPALRDAGRVPFWTSPDGRGKGSVKTFLRLFLRYSPSSLHLHLHAKPNARRTELLPGPDGRWTVRLAAPPHDGQANAVLLRFLAELFGVPRRCVTLLSGHAAPFKKVEISGLSDEAAAAVLARQYGGG